MTDYVDVNKLSDRSPVVMPEAYDRVAESPIMPYVRAFAAGLVDPMGAPSWVVNKLADTPGTEWYARRMQEAREESPVAAGMGSALVPGLGLGATVGRMTAAELLGGVGPLMSMGGGIGGIKGEIFPTRRRRPQGAYPPGGAY